VCLFPFQLSFFFEIFLFVILKIAMRAAGLCNLIITPDILRVCISGELFPVQLPASEREREKEPLLVDYHRHQLAD
jgi:hypothetical protein